MATATTTTTQQIKAAARAIELAEQHHLTGTARYIGQTDAGAELWTVPSRSHDGHYIVRSWPEIERHTCSCTAGSYGRACGHVGAVMHAEEQRVRATQQSSSSVMDSWVKGWEW